MTREPAKVKENSLPPEVDFELNRDVFRMFTRKEALFGKTNHSPFCFSLGPTYEQNMSEIDFFLLAPPKVDLGRYLHVESRS